MSFKNASHLIIFALVGFALLHYRWVAHGAEASTPVIFWASDPVQAGESVLAVGAWLKDAREVEIVRLPQTASGGPHTERALLSFAGGRKVPVIQPSQCSVKFTIPEEIGAGLYVFRVLNASGVSAPVVLNRPSPFWAQGDQGEMASPGGWVRILGKCLTNESPAGTRVHFVRKGGGATLLLQPQDATPYSLRLVLPKEMPEGEYALRVHAGTGGEAGWSAPLAITVRIPKPWPATIYNVVEFGADTTGSKDSTSAIRTALQKAAQGGVIYFPRGRYQVSDTLEIPRFVTLRGEARHLSCLLWPDRDQPLKELIKGTNSFAIEDLTLYCSNYVHFIVADQNLPDAGDVHIRRVCIRADMYRGHLKPEQVDERFRAALKNSTGGGDLLRLGGRNVEVTDCDLYASGRSIFLDRVKCARIANNIIYNGRWGWYCFMGCDCLIFENNVLAGADLMSTGGGLANYATPYSRCIYFGHNTFKNMFGWDREAMTSDAGGGAYYGPIVASGLKSLTLAEAPNWGKRDWIGAVVFILSGRGQGQWREITRYDKAEVEVDRPWDVLPDPTSLVGITMQHRHYLMVGNEFFDAGIGVQFYGTATEHIVAQNKATRAGGFNNIGKPYGGYHLPVDKNPCQQPSWYVQYFDNEILEGNMYRGHANNAVGAGDSHIGVFGWPPKPDWPWPYNFGTIVRRNILHNNAKIHLGTSPNPQYPSVSDCIVEGNTIRQADIGIQVDGGTRGVLLRRNVFEGVLSPYTGAGIARAGVHPAELALARLQGIACLVEKVPADWASAESELKALCARSADDSSLANATQSAIEKALAALSKARPAGYTSTFLEKALGVRVELAKEDRLGSLLESGSGGVAELVLKATLAEGFPQSTVALTLALPEGLTCTQPVTSAVTLSRGQPEGVFTFPVSVAPGTWGAHMVKAEVDAQVGTARFKGSVSISVGGAFIREWLVIGPFPNKSNQPLDTAVHPPEDELNLSAAYEGTGGRVQWQPVTLASNCLDLGRLLNTNQAATAYALACLVAEEETVLDLGLGCDDGARVWVNGEEVWSRTQPGRAQPRQGIAKARLVKGENIIFCKVSNTAASWQLYVSVEGEAEVVRKVHVVPAQKIAGQKVFADMGKKGKLSATVPAGPFAYEGEIEWTPVFEDDFSRLTLGSNWKPLRGTWAIQSGRLVTRQTGIIAILKKVKPPLRIEFDAKSDNPGDLSAFWGTIDKGYEGGYFVGFGSNNNTLNKILRYGQQVQESSGVLIEKGRMYHIVVHIIAPLGEPTTVELLADDKLAIRYKDPNPVTDADTPGLIAWSEGEFDNVRVYQGKMKKR